MKQHINIAIDSKYNVHSILKRYSAIRTSLFNYWSLLFYNKYLYYFFNCFFKRGKKQLAIKLVYFLLYILKKKTMISPILVLQAALLNYRHILKLKIIKYKRKKIFSYLLLSLNKQVKMSIKYLAKQFSSFNINTRKYSLVERLSIFILNLFFRTPLIFGRFLQHSAHVHKLIQDNQKGYKKTKFKKFKRRRRRRFKFKSSYWKKNNVHKRINKSTIKKKNKNIKLKSNKISNLKKQLNMQKKRKVTKLNKKSKIKLKRKIKLKKKLTPATLLKIYKRKSRKKKTKSVNTMQRRIRKVLTRSFTRLLQRRSYRIKKRKITDYTYSIKQLYTDVNSNIDFPLLTEIQTSNSFFINAISKVQARNFFFYIILGKWYKVLEKTYYYMTLPFWHLYNLRARFLKHRIFLKPIVQQLVPQVQNNYTKYLIRYLNNPSVLQQKIKETTGNSNFDTDSILLSNYLKLYRVKSRSKTHVKSKKKFILLSYKSSNKNSIDNKLNIIKIKSLRYLLQKNRLRSFLRKKIRTFGKLRLRLRLIKLMRSFYVQYHLKNRRRRYVSFINVLLQIRRYFFILIRFRLARLIWFGLRAVSMRKTKPLFESTKRNVATRVFLVKN